MPRDSYLDSVEIEGLDAILEDDDDYNDDPLDGEDYDDYGSERSDSEAETQTEKDSSGESLDDYDDDDEKVDPEIIALKSQVSQLSQILSQIKSDPSASGDNQKPKKEEIEDVVSNILKEYNEALDAVSDDEESKLTGDQLKIFTAQIGGVLLPKILKAVDDRYSKDVESASERSQRLHATLMNTVRKGALKRFYEEYPEAKGQRMLNILDRELKGDATWQNLLMNPDEDALLNHLKRVYSPFRDESKAKAESRKKKEREAKRQEARRREAERRGISTESDSGDFSRSGGEGMGIRGNLEAALRRELRRT